MTHKLFSDFFMIICSFLVSVFLAGNAGGNAIVSAELSDNRPLPGQVFWITISVEDNIDFYAAEMEVSFDSDLLKFVSVNCGELAYGGLDIAGKLEDGRTGASVSRTVPLEEIASGSFIVLEFKVNTYAVEGITDLVFSGLLVYDSSGNPVPVETLSSLSLEITGTISDLRLLVPAVSMIDEGEFFHVDALLFASGLTDDERVTCEVGFSFTDSDPEGWGEDQWQEMIFSGVDDGSFLNFTAETAFMRSPGEWFIALRASLDDGNIIYGGLTGLWDNVESTSARLIIAPRPPFRYALAKWDFDNESLMPSHAVFDNMEAEVNLSGANITGYTAGAGGQAVNSNGWDYGPGNPKYWMLEISTISFVSLELSSKQYGSGTGPREFAVQYSLDGSEWHPVEGGDIVVGSNWSSGKLDRLSLPQDIEDRDRVFLRWIMISDISIGDETVGSSGTNRIDDILITGINSKPQLIEVYPGDTNNDGLVNADDVLPLGLYWLTNGPPAVWENTGFLPRATEQWVPPGSTFADTNGDGVVDHSDLVAVGLHFGKATGDFAKDSKAPLSTLEVDPLDGERIKRIMVMSGQEIAVRGVAFGVEFTGIPAGSWEIKNVSPAFAETVSDNEIIYFGSAVDNVFEAAVVLKGAGDDITGRILTGFDLVIDEGFDEVFTVNLNRLSVSTRNSAGERIGSGELVFSGSLSTSGLIITNDRKTVLKQNYPNPFEYFTLIPLKLNSASLVRIDIADIRGSVIETSFNGYLEEGRHEILIDGHFLPPGVYICRIITPEGLMGVIKIVKAHK